MTLAADRETDVERQHQIVENLIEQGVERAGAGARRSQGGGAGGEEGQPGAGMPVLIVDSDIHRPTAASAGASTLTYIGSDNVAGGRIAGEAVARWLGGQGAVAVLEGIPGHESTDQRRQGFAEALAAHPGLRSSPRRRPAASGPRGSTSARTSCRPIPI